MKYKKIYKYLMSSDIELKVLAIGLLANNKKALNYISYTYGYKFEYFIKYYYDVISKLEKDSYIIDSYFSLISEIIAEVNFQKQNKRKLTTALLLLIPRLDVFSIKYLKDGGKLYILIGMFKYTKFFRKHKRRSITWYNNELVSLEDVVNIIEKSIYNGHFNYTFLNKFTQILKTFKK